MLDVLVVGAGPAGVAAALRAADLGAKTTLVTRDEFGGMAANDGPIPVRTLAHAARLLREARQLERYGIDVGALALDYPKLLLRVREVVTEARGHAAYREQIDAAGAVVHERTGAARFVDPHTIETDNGLRLQADKIVICTGGKSRRLAVPGAELTATHSDAWGLRSIPASMLVIGGGRDGRTSRLDFQRLRRQGSAIPERTSNSSRPRTRTCRRPSPRRFARRASIVRESFGEIESFEAAPGGVRMKFVKDGRRESAEAELAVVAVGWTAETEDLNLGAAGVETTSRGFVGVDAHLRTSASHIFAAGDVTGRLMLVPQALQDGFVAATNACSGRRSCSRRSRRPRSAASRTPSTRRWD